MKQRGVSLRTYLAVQVMAETGCSRSLAIEAVASTAIEHPETDYDERRTWDEWNVEIARQRAARDT